MIVVAITALAIAATPPDYDTRYFEVRELNNAEGCALTGDWTLEGRSTIYVQVEQETDGSLAVSATSYGWTRLPSDAIKLLGLSFHSTGQESQVFTMAGYPTSPRPGLVSVIREDERELFLRSFASSQSVNIYPADIPPEDEDAPKYDLKLALQAGLTGSSDAVASLRRCVADVKRREDARRAREARNDHITKDPFSD